MGTFSDFEEVDPSWLEEYEKEMEDAIPKIVNDHNKRRSLADDARMRVMKTPNKRELIEIGKKFLEHAPQPADSCSPGLVGFRGEISVCNNCASRIILRGCDLKLLADKAVWEPEILTCDLCCG